MEETWIEVTRGGDRCKLTFQESCHIILDDCDVKYVISELWKYLFNKSMVEA